ncbi:hypothetical protein VCM_00001 [Pseudomonas phage VCM]|uniref:Uncharacterized protein n=1 Tax=Pseudomonas phage VCM TaxID=1729937 RepID=A0A0S4KZ22_9CAUD|nr:hypothetical protein VCM_00001 [Pseudomonas phage VCM]CUR44220.1 hypothetical protein VCM_00001 [Pseudomonas phage VCM]
MNVMTFAHFKVKRLVRMGSKLKYALMLKRELQSAHWMLKRNGLDYMVNELKAYKKTEERVEREISVVRSIVGSALAMGYKVSVHDSECWAVRQSTDKAAIMAEIYTTDMNTLKFRNQAGESVGFVSLVYGNSASEVMSDWTDSEEMNKILDNAKKQCDRYAAKGW